MDNTELFQKLLSSVQPSNKTSSDDPHHQVAPFLQHAIQLRIRLSAIEAFVARVSESYLLVRPRLSSEVPFLSDSERSVIDDNLERQLHESWRYLEQLKQEVKKIQIESSSGHNGVREHYQIVVVSLLSRLSDLSKCVGQLQTAHYEAVLLSQSPFSTWFSTPKGDSYENIYKPQSSQTRPTELFVGSGPRLLLNALNSTLTPSEGLAKAGRIRSRDASTSEDWSYAVLLAAAHEQLANKGDESLPGSFFGSATERVLSRELNDQQWKKEWNTVLAVAPNCWHWRELRSKLLEGGEDQTLFETVCHSSRSDWGTRGEVNQQEDDFQLYLEQCLRQSQTESTTKQEERVVEVPSQANSLVAKLQTANRSVEAKHIKETSQARISRVSDMQQQQQRLMEQEHQSLGVELAGELEGVLQTEMKMREVSEIMSLFSDKVAAQTQDVEAIFETTEAVVDDVDAGHEQLISASKRRRVARHIYVSITLVLSFVLLVMDFVFD